MYLDLLKRVLRRTGFAEERHTPLFAPPLRGRSRPLRAKVFRPIERLLARRGLELVRTRRDDPALRVEGKDWPSQAETMVGVKRLDNVEHCLARELRDGVPGDLMEAGVWRGGACIFMRAVLRAYGDNDRVVWLADSFEGLPEPDPDRFPADAGFHLSRYNAVLGVSLDQVKANFERYDLLDDRVRFLKGWFRDTLPDAPVGRLALLRLDGDLYESTIQALEGLYPKLSPGGYVIVDDYGALKPCRAAVDHYREKHYIEDEIRWADWSGIYWRRS